MMNKTDSILELSAPYDNEYQGTYRRVLFVCSAGMLRSATAARVGANLGFNTRACGSERYALIPLSANLVYWAQSIFFVNEYNYLSALDTFKDEPDVLYRLNDKSTVWDIEDIYDYRDPKLVQIIVKLLA